MEAAELLRKVRRIEIRSRMLGEDLFSGSRQSAFKGRGVEFEEVRPYVPGDEVRDIDWNVTARLGAPFVKRFVEEREITVMLVVDVSRSMQAGVGAHQKRDFAAQLCALLGFGAMRNDDRVGLLLVAGAVEHFVPPARGRQHLLRMLRDVLGHETRTAGTRLGEGARFLTRTLRRRALVFWISDAEDRLESRDWRVLAKRHEVVLLVPREPRDRALPGVGRVLLEDLETGEQREAPTASVRFRRGYEQRGAARFRATEQLLARARCPLLELDEKNHLAVLMRYFAQAAKRRRAVA